MSEFDEPVDDTEGQIPEADEGEALADAPVAEEPALRPTIEPLFVLEPTPVEERMPSEPTPTEESLPREPVAVDERVPSEPAPVEEPAIELTLEEPTSVEEPARFVPLPAAAPPQAADGALAEAVGGGLTWIPYAVYLGAWLGLAGASAYLLKDATPENPARWMPAYAGIVWGGVALVALGPVIAFSVWLVARARRPKGARTGLLASALIRGALTAVFGVAIWLATLYVLELVATGVFS